MVRSVLFLVLFLVSLALPSIDDQVLGQALEDSVPNIVVNSLLDNPRGCPQNCTLRSAINDAQPGDVIGFDSDLSGVLVLVQPLVINKDITIRGPGAEILAIDGDNRLRVFQIERGAVSISGLTIQNGHRDEGFDNWGGAVDNRGALDVTRVTFQNNSACTGGAIFNGDSLTITESLFSNNQSVGGCQHHSSGKGGAIYTGTGGNEVNINSTTFQNNSATSHGGAIFIYSSTTFIFNSTFTQNSAEQGGAVANGGSQGIQQNLWIISSDFHNNLARGHRQRGGGGAIMNSPGGLIVESSLFSNNEAPEGGAINLGVHTTNAQLSGNFFVNNIAQRGGGIFNNSANYVFISSSVFSDNSAPGGDNPYLETDGGGAIYNWGALVLTTSSLSENFASNGGGILNLSWRTHIINSTIYGNVAQGSGGGIYNVSALNISSSTIAGNSANVAGGVINTGTHATLELENTIIANNQASRVNDIDGSVTSLSNNLIGDASDSSGWFAGDLLDADPMLGEPQSVEERIWVVPLSLGSPAIGAGFCEGTPPLQVDQRDLPRKTPCDIGAYETQQ